MRLGRVGSVVAAIAPVASAGVAGSLVTQPAIPGWYAGLAKPWYTPPNWAFAPAWTILYALMAYAFWRILVLPRATPGKGGAIAAFLVQIALNGLWSFAFFGLRSPAAGLVAIAFLCLAIATTFDFFRRLDRAAAWLLAPYLAWTSYAAALNAGVWLLNR